VAARRRVGSILLDLGPLFMTIVDAIRVTMMTNDDFQGRFGGQDNVTTADSLGATGVRGSAL
jgi:hypothetical protein